MKLNKKIIILIIVIFLIILIYESFCTQINSININWNLNLPNADKELYYVDSGASFFGDGFTYTVAKYTSKKKQNILLDRFKWNSTIPSEEIEEINYITSNLEIDENYSLKMDENILYLSITGEDKWSKLYLIYLVEHQTMYIIENVI